MTPSELSITSLIGQASFFVQFIMFLLVSASIFCWSIVIQKFLLLKKIERELDEFEAEFWAYSNKNELDNYYKQITAIDRQNSISQIFQVGYEFQNSYPKSLNSKESFFIQLERFMQVTALKVVNSLNSYLSILATIGSVSPYIGLLGTVWGIINSFTALGSATHATISMVAPGIAEALIATAMGLFAAIPAVIFYNIFSKRIDQISEKIGFFIDEYLVSVSLKNE